MRYIDEPSKLIALTVELGDDKHRSLTFVYAKSKGATQSAAPSPFVFSLA